MYIDTGSSVPGVPSKSRDLADENIFFFDGMEMIRNNRIGQQIKILERLQRISDGWSNGRTDGRPAFPYPLLRFAGMGDKKIMMTELEIQAGLCYMEEQTKLSNDNICQMV